jgi:RNA polymerase sigma-70 factor (ECF subfamily)
MSDTHEITALLAEWANGNRQALDDLVPRVYEELRRLAAVYLKNERPGHTLEPTALVHEAYLRLMDQRSAPNCRSRYQFFGIAARLMREILVDHARRRQRMKRTGQKVPLAEAVSLPVAPDTDLVTLDARLDSLEKLDHRKCQIAELRYFGGLSVEEIAESFDLSTKTIRRELKLAQAWLSDGLRQEAHS